MFDRVPRNLIVSAARSVPRMDVVYKLVSAQEIVTMDSIALEASVPLVACEMLNAQLARLVLKANALILARSCNVDQMQFVKHLDTEPYVYVPKDSNEMLEQADVEKLNAREMLIAQKIEDVTTTVCVSTHVNNLAFVEEMHNVAQEITERNVLAQLDLSAIHPSDVNLTETSANRTPVDKMLVVLILWVRMNASVTQDALETLSSDANAHPSLQSTPVRERGAEQMHNVDPEVVKANASVQKNSPMEILMSDVPRQISVSSL